MKKIIFTLMLSFCSILSISAMSYEEAREQARFLTDKMAYELNLNDMQYNDCYEINLDYLLGVRTVDDIYGTYLTYRNADIRHILYDWQYSLFVAADYFFHPLSWYRGAWYFPVYRYYTVGHFYYAHPTIYYSYRGGHGRCYHRCGYYVSRRPHWHGGFRGMDRCAVSRRGGYYRQGCASNGGNYRGGNYSSRQSYQGSRSGGYRIEGSSRGTHNGNSTRQSYQGSRSGSSRVEGTSRGSYNGNASRQDYQGSRGNSITTSYQASQGSRGNSITTSYQASQGSRGNSSYVSHQTSASRGSSYSRPSSTRTTVHNNRGSMATTSRQSNSNGSYTRSTASVGQRSSSRGGGNGSTRGSSGGFGGQSRGSRGRSL